MKVLTTSIALLTVLGGTAFAQAPQPPAPPSEQAAQVMINQLTSEKYQLLTQLATAQKSIADLQKELADAKKVGENKSGEPPVGGPHPPMNPPTKP